jgi:large repetitive protein
MKKLFFVGLSVLVQLNAGLAIAQAGKAGKQLPLVFDPLTKKYFIGGNSKFQLKQSEQSNLIDRIEVSVDGGEFKPYGESIEFKSEGKHSLKFRAVTSINNWSAVQFVEVFVDLTAPTSEFKFPDDKFYKDETGVYVAHGSALSIVAQDNLSGVAAIEYSWDGTNFTDYSKPLKLEKLGKQTLYYRTADRVGNAEPMKKTDIIVDGSSPTSTLTLKEAPKTVQMNGRTYVSDSAALAIEATDDVSKVKQIWVGIDGAAPTPYIKPIYFLQEGPHALKYYAVDNVGNKEPEKTINLYTVSTPPQSTVATIGKLVNTGGINYATRELQVKIDARDNAVGLERIEVKVDNDVEFKSYVEPLRFKTPGLHTLSYRAVDRVGNHEPTRTFLVNVHEAAPETTMVTAQPMMQRNGVTYSPSPNVISFNVNNSVVGVDKILVSLNDGPYTTYQNPITLTSDQRSYKVSYKSVDKLGNEETPKVVSFNMVGAIPIVDLFISNGQNAEEQVRTNYLEQPTSAARTPSAAPAKAGKK